MLIAQWTGRIIGKMHIHQVSQMELAEQLGMTPEYVGKVLNGKRESPNAKERFNAALDEIIKNREAV